MNTQVHKAKAEPPVSQQRDRAVCMGSWSVSPREAQIQRALGNWTYGRLVQAKLTVGAPGDPYEREADRVADQVTRAPEPALQRECDCGGTCATCEEEYVQTKSVAGHASTVPSEVASHVEALKGEGQPLSAAARAYFEPRFGVDFGGVRLHTGHTAVTAAQGLNARAFTVGHDIAFNVGAYAPETQEGRRLIAHELTHVVQQARRPAPHVQREEVCTPDDSTMLGMIDEGDLLYTEVGGSIYVVRADDVRMAWSETIQDPVGVESEQTCEAFDRAALEAAFAEVGAPTRSRVYMVTPSAPDSYLLIYSLLLDQEGRSSEVSWEDIDQALDRNVGVDEGAARAAATGSILPGPWNPPGNQPIPYYLGNSAHIAIAANYVAEHPGDAVETNFTPISSILRRFAEMGLGETLEDTAPTSKELASKPDILNLTRQHLYEIKPSGGAGLAATEAAFYVAAFAKAGIVITLGPSSEPGVRGVVVAPAGHFTFASPAPGVIVYQYRRGPFVPVPKPVEKPVEKPVDEPVERRWYEWEYWEELTGLTGLALVAYLVFSEGSRVIPARNLVPVP